MNSHRATVLFIPGHADTFGGGEMYLLRVISHLDPARFHAVVVLPGEGSLREPLETLGAEVIVLEAKFGNVRDPLRWYGRLAEMRHRTHEIVGLIRSKGIRLVHSNNNTRLDGALAARIAGVPHVYVAHNVRDLDGIYSWLKLDQASFASLMGSLSTRIVAVSHSVASTLVPPLPTNSVRVIHNGIDFTHFDAAARSPGPDLRDELGLPQDTVFVTAVGRISREKGFDYLAEVAARVVAAKPQAHFVVAGSDSDAQLTAQLRSAVASTGIEANFHLLGYRQDLPRLLRQSNIFALSSRSEGHPYVLLEAMAARCAIVAFRCTGVEETVADGLTGLLTDVGDVNGMARAILQLLADPGQLERFADAAFTHVRAHFDIVQGVRSLMEIYDEALGERMPPPGDPLTDLCLDIAHEIGVLGAQVRTLSEKVRELEQLSVSVRSNPVVRVVRRVAKALRHVRPSSSR